jgi:hypothetical protein
MIYSGVWKDGAMHKALWAQPQLPLLKIDMICDLALQYVIIVHDFITLNFRFFGAARQHGNALTTIGR